MDGDSLIGSKRGSDASSIISEAEDEKKLKKTVRKNIPPEVANRFKSVQNTHDSHT